VEQWIERIGPLAVFFGLMIEGEMALILAGYAVNHGYLELVPTLLMGTAGGVCTDALYFWLGRRYGARLLRSRPGLRPLRARAVLLLRRYGHLMAFAVRFAIGLRIVLPIVMGASRMPPRVYHLYNAFGSLTFSVVYLAVGYGFGQAIHRLIARWNLSEVHVLGAIVVIGALIWAVHEWRLSRRPPEPVGKGRVTRRR